MSDAAPPEGFNPGTPYVGTATIDAAAATVWRAISAPGGLVRYHPFCEANPVDNWPGAGSSDHVYYRSGLVVHRDFRAWHDGLGYDLDLGPAGKKVSRVVWRVSDKGATSAIAITVFPLLKIGATKAQIDTHLARTFGGSMTPYLDALVQGLKHWVETETPVVADQFGPVPGFSAQP